ncbi:4-hydroxybenzoate octaprenyltransferase [Palleronia sediminis]|uniref:4-hydroxybenzoate octaprenyltransferase n=1 Tax=Palleronia sediminis TaxID=2547833 RepID=A0A4R5ZY57_9RHOB|nr:4-hydroxybenzoate octaprenyltransferase [Palleronia sediminis]TDL75215.1 4-hydroxybenzoate octaprenyltransferase [Palleronia sediminis]
MTGTEATKGQVADAVKGNWVDERAPARLRPYLRLSRADRPIGTWLLLLPCWWGLALAAAEIGALGWRGLWIAIGCAIGAALMRGAGCTWNDITDRHIDGGVTRTRSRPIPSGQVTVAQAAAWMVAQCLLALAILLTFPLPAILLGVAALVPVAIYPFAKRFTWWPQVFLGLAFNWGALLAYTAQKGAFDWPALALYLGGIAWTLFYDTIYAYQDIEDDALIGVKSTARLFGDRPRPWLRAFMVLACLFMALAVVLALGTADHFLALAIALGAPWALGWHMAWQLGKLDTGDSAVCLRLFRANRDAGLLATLFLAAAVMA